MTHKKPADFSPKLLELYDFYVHGIITKRDFLGRAASLGIGAVAATTMLGQLMPNYAQAQTVNTDDITETRISYNSPDGHGTVNALMARPKGTEPLGAVLVIHENRGLNPYIEDVVRRVAKAGYLALGPDGLSALGGYPGNDDEGRTMQRSLDGAKVMADFFAGFEFLQTHPQSTGKVGAVGFCYGGGVCNALAVAYPTMACSVPFYGRQAEAADVPAIQAPLLLHFAETDTRINAGWPAYEAALKIHNKVYEAYTYPGVGHGFHNNTTPRYNEDAASLAWAKTLSWFETYLT